MKAHAAKPRPAPKRTAAGAAFTRLILAVFRFHGRLLAAGDLLTGDLGLTSARWQVLGAIDERPLPVAQIARNMGLTRQGVQRTADALARDGFVAFAPNPDHRRAKLLALTERGRRTLDAVNRRQVAWANAATARADAAAIDAAADTVRALRTTLDIGAEKKEGG